MTRKELEANCPEGYTVALPGQNIDMLGKTEFWGIYEHHSEPDLVRIPQDLVDTPDGPPAKRIPREWGRLLYCKVV
jgi:hypothetical protein